MIRALAVFSLVATSVLAQRTPLNGRVTDEKGAVIAGAEITLSAAAGTSGKIVTGPDGEFRLGAPLQLPAVLRAEKPGFRAAVLRVDEATSEPLLVVLKVHGVEQSIVVTAEGIPQLSDETAKAVSTVSADEIQSRGESTLAETLRSVPGLQIFNSGGPGQNTSFRIRGLRPDAAAVLIDGLRFRDAATTQGDASSFLSTMNLVSTDHVEVLRGSGASLYGTNAAGGVVNLVSSEGGPPFGGDFQLGGGSLGMIRSRGGLHGGALSDRLKYSIGVSRLNVANGVDGNDGTHGTGLQGRGSFAASKTLVVTARFYGSDDDVRLNMSPTTSGVPPASIPDTGPIIAVPLSSAGVDALNAGNRPAFGDATFVPGRDDPDNRRSSRFSTAVLLVKQAFSSRADWQASYQRLNTSRIFENGPSGTGSQPAALAYTKSAGRIDTADFHVGLQPVKLIHLTAGYEFEREHYFNNQDNNLPGTRRVLATAIVSQVSHAAYVASQVSLLDRRLQVSISGRAQSFGLSQPQFHLSGTVDNYTGVRIPSPPEALTADVSVAYFAPASSTKVRAHAGNAYRAPALFERFGGGFSSDPVSGVVSFTAYGDPRLSPDRYNSLDAGLDQYLFGSRIRLSATAFYSRVVSITAFDSSGAIRPATDPFRRTQGYINGSGGISRGVELSVEAQPGARTTVRGGYTYANANTDRDITVREFWKVFGVQPHVFTFNVTHRWNSKLETALDLFHGSAYYSSFFAAGRSRAFRFPGFTKADFVASYRIWQQDRRTARLQLKVDNFLNQRYFQNGWLAPRATLVTGVGYSF